MCRMRPSRTASVKLGKSDVKGIDSFRFFVGRGPHLGAIALMKAVPHVHPCCLVSSRLRFFNQDAHARSTPPLGSILPSVYEDGFHSHQCTLWLPLSAVGCCRHRSAVGGNYEPMGGCHSHSLASSHFVRSILGDQIGVDEVVLDQASRESKLSAKNSLTRAKIPARPTRRLSSANVKSISSLTSVSVVGASRLHAFSNATLNHGVSKSVTMGKSPRAKCPWIDNKC